MSNALEMALRLFSPKGALHEPSSGSASSLGRDEFIGALQVAAKDNPQRYQYLMADHLGDEKAIQGLLAHFSTILGCGEADGMAMAILLRRPLPEQLDKLVLSHPHYDKERRRAAVVMERAKRTAPVMATSTSACWPSGTGSCSWLATTATTVSPRCCGQGVALAAKEPASASSWEMSVPSATVPGAL